MAAVIAQMIVDKTGQDVIDDGTTATLKANLIAAIDNIATGQVQTAESITCHASGTPDALTGAFTPPITALVDGQFLLVRAAAANTTATPTFKPNTTLAAKPIVKGSNTALAVGDIAGAAHWLELQYDSTLDKWVLLNPAIPSIATEAQAEAGTDNSTIMTPLRVKEAVAAQNGGYVKKSGDRMTGNLTVPVVAATTNVTVGGNGVWHAGNFNPATKADVSQFTNSLAANGYQRLQGGLILQWGTGDGVSGSATANYTFPISFPNACFMVNPTVNWSANSGASPGWHLDNVLQSGFSITSTTGNVISSIQWMAVGH